MTVTKAKTETEQKGPALYILAEEYRAAANKLADTSLDEQTIADTLEGLAGGLEEKAVNIARFIRNTEAMALAMTEEAKRMAQRAQACANRAESVRAYLHTHLVGARVLKIEHAQFTIKVQDNPGAVAIDDVTLIPKKYMRQPPKPAAVPDKVAIKLLLNAGKVVPGAHLDKGTRLVIA